MEAAERHKAAGTAQFKSLDYAAAHESYLRGAKLLAGDEAAVELHATLLSNAALCALKCSGWWQAAFAAAAASAVLYQAGGAASLEKYRALAAKARFREAVAALGLGLLSSAVALLEGGPQGDADFAKQLASAKKRLAAINGEDDGDAIESEYRQLVGAVGADAAGEKQGWVDELSATAAGRERLCTLYGFLDARGSGGWAEPLSRREAARVRYAALRYSVKKLFQAGKQAKVEAALGVRRWVTPAEAAANAASGLAAPSATLAADLPPQAHAALAPTNALLDPAQVSQLQQRRFVVIDPPDAAHQQHGHVSLDAVARAADEARRWIAEGVMHTDPEDGCNPEQRATELQFWSAASVDRLRAAQPGLSACADVLNRLRSTLAQALDIGLRVPTSMMLASYPTSAFYRPHLDSYGPDDNPRLLTVLLYLAWEPREGGELRLHSRPAEGEAGDSSTSAQHIDITPVPGRIVIFYAREVEHEVRPSRGERIALTLWLWTQEEDDYGR